MLLMRSFQGSGILLADKTTLGSILTPHPLAIHPRLADIAFITLWSSARTTAHKCHGSGPNHAQALQR